MINQVFNTGIFPERLKLAKVIPVFKKGDSKLINNYRPISLIPVISNVLEKIIANQLSQYFEDNKLFHDNQYGFRTGLSTEYATIELTDIILSNMDRNEIPFSICLDLSKAFDTLDHTIVLQKLKHYGIDGKALHLCESYLTNRSQYLCGDKWCKIRTTANYNGCPPRFNTWTITFYHLHKRFFTFQSSFYLYIICRRYNTLQHS